MRLHRFFIDSDLGPYKASGIFLIEDVAINHQLAKVLRATTGDPIQLFDRIGNQITGTIQSIKKNETAVRIDLTETRDGSDKKTTLYLAMLKRENFEIAAQKATEVGINTIVPLLTERTVKTGFNRARLEKIVIEASEQSCRTTISTITEPMSFETALKTNHEIKLFLDFDGNIFENKMIEHKKDIAIFVGPEGGWGELERKNAQENQCLIATISTQTLRAETAAIIGAYLIAQ